MNSNYLLPDAFVSSIRDQLGPEAEAFFASYDEPSLRGIRFRDKRIAVDEAELLGPIPYARNAYYLSEDSAAGAAPLHEAGAYYLQEPSAMAAAAVLAPQDGDRVLDLCSAPGGKATQLAASASLSLLVANEPVPSRAQILSRNIERMGIPNAVITCAYPQQLTAKWPQFFDRILVDAPCSGEGMFRRHPETRAEWTPDSPARCHARQNEILDSAALMLRAGGRLVYSTCTFNRLEDEETIAVFLNTHSNFRLLPINVDGLPDAPDGMLRLWPHRFNGEGHFIALLEKTSADDRDSKPASPVLPTAPKRDEAALFREFAFEHIPEKGITADAVLAGHLCHTPAAVPPLDGIRVLRLGLQLGDVRGKVFVPDHALALAAGISPCYPLDENSVASYLHGDSLQCDDSFKGYYAMTYSGWQIGFGKASNGQMKNHYPKGLRK